MSINAISAKSTAEIAAKPLPTKGGFSQVMNSIFPEKIIRSDLHTEIQQLRTDLVHGKKFSAQELLYYQIRFGEFNLNVEMLSKLAEGASATLKRFEQAGQ